MSEERKITVRPATRQIMKTSRVGIYCRVSTRTHERLDSLTNQVSFLTKMVSAKLDWRLVDVYLDVRSGSAVKERNEFQRMIRARHKIA